jgi:hypothetical protein
LPFSHKIPEYIARILFPSFFFAIYLAAGVGLVLARSTVCRLTKGVPGLETADSGRGVRERDIGGEWKAYVINNERERITSWLRFDLTRTSNAAM